MQKIVSQLDAAGYFVGPVSAETSPLEPGKFLIPSGCIDRAPPVVPQGMRARWMINAWAFEVASTQPDGQPAPQTVEEWRNGAVVTRFQALAALHLAGRLAAVETHMALPTTDPLAKLAFKNALEFRRMSPTVVHVAGVLAMTSIELDALFQQAATIEA